MCSFNASLHNHTHYSNIRLRDCIVTEKDLIDYAVQLGHKAVAITDHECLSGSLKAIKHYKKVKEKNPDFKLILGNEIYLTRNGLNADNFVSGVDKYYHFILLAKDAIGHKQLREISTRAWKRSYVARRMRRVPTYYQDLLDIIGKEKGHVVGSTACLGSAIGTQLLIYHQTKNQELWNKILIWCQQMASIFGKEDFYLELQPSHGKEQTIVNNYLLQIAKDYGYKYIITTDTHYLKKNDASIHAAYLNSQDGDREVASFYATTYLMDTQEVESYLKYIPQEQLHQAYAYIDEIIDKCEFYDLEKPLKIPRLFWYEEECHEDKELWCKRIPSIKLLWDSDYYGDVLLANKIINKIVSDPTLQNQEMYNAVDTCVNMSVESSNVNHTHWSAYFLNLQGIIQTGWDAGSLIMPGRGSGVGFVLLYLLDITQINPLRETVKTEAWRFLNPSRVSVLDVDIDCEGGRRKAVLNKFREVYGIDRVANVATFGTEKAKSAILTSCRGLGLEPEVAAYLASLVPSDRGIQRTLRQCMYGDEENEFEPIKQFVNEMTYNYPEVWNIAIKIEGLVNKLGSHAGGVIFVDEPFVNSVSLMRSPDGTIITAYELHDAESCGLIKYDILSIEAADCIHTCLDLLIQYGQITPKEKLRQTYEDVVGVYNLERDNPEMWKMVWEHKISRLFQFEKQSGIAGIALTKPKSVEDLAHLNSIIRLMAQEKNAELPLNKYARFKQNIELWYKEMSDYGLTQEEQELLKKELFGSYGICEVQEQFMRLVQMPECGGFDLNWSDRLRKSIAKKNPAEYEALEKEYFIGVKEKGLSLNLCNYVWRVLVATSKGYGFNALLWCVQA